MTGGRMMLNTEDGARDILNPLNGFMEDSNTFSNFLPGILDPSKSRFQASFSTDFFDLVISEIDRILNKC
jgi:hypothetical protein